MYLFCWNNSSHKCTCVWVTEMLHSAGDEPEHKMHLCHSLCLVVGQHIVCRCSCTKFLARFSHTQYHICRNFERNCLKETLKSEGGHIFWILLLCLKLVLCIHYVKAVPLQAWSGPEGSRKLRFPDFMTTAQDGGKVVSLTHRPPLPPGNFPGTHFC